MDPLSRTERSVLMAKVRGRGNKSTEIALARLFRRAKISGWRRHLRLVGIPDFAFPLLRLAVFVDGCFWHGCPHCRRNAPSTNRSFWHEKIAANRGRDREVRRLLHRSGWTVLRIWEHELKNQPSVASRVRGALAKAKSLKRARRRKLSLL